MKRDLIVTMIRKCYENDKQKEFTATFVVQVHKNNFVAEVTEAFENEKVNTYLDKEYAIFSIERVFD